MRVIDDEGKQLGILSTPDAMRMARERGVDLVEVAPNAVPPVCRLLDYGKYKYEQTKREREARKHQKGSELKEVRLTPKTDEHDLLFKARTVQRFLVDGDKVKVTVRFKGREMAHPQLGRQVLEFIAQNVKGSGAVERMPLMEGRAMHMIIAPTAPAVPAAPAAPVASGAAPASGEAKPS